MSEHNVVDIADRESLSELLRKGARELIQRAVEAELASDMEGFQGRHWKESMTKPVNNVAGYTRLPMC